MVMKRKGVWSPRGHSCIGGGSLESHKWKLWAATICKGPHAWWRASTYNRCSCLRIHNCGKEWYITTISHWITPRIVTNLFRLTNIDVICVNITWPWWVTWLTVDASFLCDDNMWWLHVIDYHHNNFWQLSKLSGVSI